MSKRKIVDLCLRCEKNPRKVGSQYCAVCLKVHSMLR